MWEVGLPPSPLKFSFHCHFQKLSCSCLLGSAAAPADRHVCLQFMWEVGLPSSHKLLCSWLLGMGPAPATASPAHPAFYLQSRERFLSPNLQRSGRPTLFPACLNCSYCLLLSFSFFPGWRSVSPGGYAALVQACLWGYRGTAKLTWSASSQAVWAPGTGPRGPPRFSI
jgi:hypothetical protein